MLEMKIKIEADAAVLKAIDKLTTALTGVKVGSAVRAGLIVGHFSQPPARLSSIQKRS